ncbi:MAG: ECF transporter S component [Limosilactobacillus sp.]|uniref:ECF transporter S component n=1 Tax=Limosilactobacillus sp. TaxID=2773925 RepID=UPI0027020F4B|nr:ECF transporter S component [Limosilactobacillus sp.]
MIRREKIRQNAIRAILIAIIILQDFVPFLGNIPIGPLSLTTLHVTVIVSAVVLGPVDGAIIGATWGILTWVRAFMAPSSPLAPLVMVNPLVSVLPRILIGFVAGYLYRWLSKITNGRLSMVIAAIAGSLTNTILVIGFIYLFYRTPAVAHAYGVNVDHLLIALGTIVATNGTCELILAAIATPLISIPLLKIRPNK